MLNGILGCLIGVIIFLAGYYFGLDTADKLKAKAAWCKELPDELEIAKRETEQREYNKALEAMTAYSADIAYGRNI